MGKEKGGLFRMLKNVLPKGNSAAVMKAVRSWPSIVYLFTREPLPPPGRGNFHFIFHIFHVVYTHEKARLLR